MDTITITPYNCSITSIPEGVRVFVEDIQECTPARERLNDLGIFPGTPVKILRKAAFRGPMVIEVRGSQMALGYGLASKIIVKPFSGSVDNG